MVLEDVGSVGEAVGVSDESFSDIGEGVLPDLAGDVLREDAVASERAEEALEVVGICGGGRGGRGEDTCEDLGGGERRVGA